MSRSQPNHLVRSAWRCVMSRNDPPAPDPSGVGWKLPLIMALACGVSVANGYFPQALTPLIAHGLGIAPATAAGVAPATHLGPPPGRAAGAAAATRPAGAAGVFLVVPVGGRLPRRPLITGLLTVTALALL